MAGLDLVEQRHVRTALRHLRIQIGAWAPVAAGLHLAYATVEKVVNGRRPVTLSVALRVAYFLDISPQDLLNGRFAPGACPHCGHVPDFADEPTVVEDAPPPASPAPAPAPQRGLRLVR